MLTSIMAQAARTELETPVNFAHGDELGSSNLEERLPVVLSVIAGMVDLIGFFTLGGVFTAHVTGNLVLVAAAAVHGGPWNPSQVLPIPVFILAVAAAWLTARVSNLRGLALTRLFLVVQFLLLLMALIFSVSAAPSKAPHGSIAGVAVTIAVSSMAFQYALLRLAMPEAVSTAVMTGNLTNAVLSLMELLSPLRPLMLVDRDRLKRSLRLLVGFLVGCAVAAGAIPTMGDWVWSLPVMLAAIAIGLR